MSHKLYKWELALAAGVLGALIWGAGTASAQGELADAMIRLHVIANSDSDRDQEQKLAVRDAVLEQVRAWSEQAGTTGEMEELLSAHLEGLERTGERTLRELGCSQTVTASLTNCWFPTKEYGDFALPAGEYTALRIVIGAGEGKNWWCVAFPPLCVGASAQSVEEAAQAGFFTQEQAELLTGQGDGYVLKFKSMELLGQLKELVFRVVT